MPALWQDLMLRHDYMIIFVPYRGRVAYHDDAAALYIGFVKGGHMNDKKRQCPAKVLLQLFVSFLRIGLFTFGGGYAMIPLIQKETVENKRWISDEDILEIIAIAESTPGPIAINSATFVGWRVGGFLGALLATLGVVIPSFAVITVISFFLNEFKHIRAVAYAHSSSKLFFPCSAKVRAEKELQHISYVRRHLSPLPYLRSTPFLSSQAVPFPDLSIPLC